MVRCVEGLVGRRHEAESISGGGHVVVLRPVEAQRGLQARWVPEPSGARNVVAKDMC